MQYLDDIPMRESLPFKELVTPEDVAWWKQKANGSERVVRALTGFSSEICAEIFQKYGVPLNFTKERMFVILQVLKLSPGYYTGPYVCHQDCSPTTFWERVNHDMELLADIVDDVRFADRLRPFNHSQHYPYYVTGMIDTFPVACLAGDTGDASYQPKYSKHVKKMQVVIDWQGRIIAWSRPHVGSRSDPVLYGEKIQWRSMHAHEFFLADGIYSNNNNLI